MNPTVVILLSDKRSGSTIFQKEIGSHPQIRQVGYSPHRYLETQHWMKAAALLDQPLPLYYGHRQYGAFRNRSNARALLVDELQGNLPDFDCQVPDRELIFGGWEALCQSLANPVFFEKSPQHLAQWACLSLILEWMAQTRFEVRLIGLVRNPMAVLYSAFELFRNPAEVRQFGWADMYRNLMAMQTMVAPEQFHLVRYEDMVEFPDQTFDAVYRFIGLEPHQTGREVHDRSTNRWASDPWFTVQLHESVKQVGRHYGYSDEEMSNPPKPGPSSWQRMQRACRHTYQSGRHRLVERWIKPRLLRWRQRGNNER